VTHLLSENPLPGIDPRRLRKLADAGLDSLESLVEAGLERVADVTGFDRKTSRALVRVAQAALSRHDRDVIEFSPAQDEPSSERLGRGLDAARRVERAVSIVRKARSHTRRHPAKPSWARAHRKARKQLRKLLDELARIQRSVLSDGLTHVSNRHLKDVLQRMEESLAIPLEQDLRKRSLRRFSKTARRTRGELAPATGEAVQTR
jgi:sugar phosphate isomerase/epimerase